ALVPLGVLLQLLITQLATSVALVVATRSLGSGEPFRLKPLGPACGAGAVAAAVTIVIALIPLAGLLIVLVFSLGLVGPPLVAQAIAVEDLGLKPSLKRAGEMARRFPTGLAAIVGVSAALGVISLVLLGAALAALADAPSAMRTVVISGVQPLVLGSALAYLAALQLVVFERARQPGLTGP
ncbi:MAG TPA: hypothetical protein VNP73_10530, partial [Actinomycetota bacterium]|nr:hypothetical protein [Actinomycetota bacterium]